MVVSLIMKPIEYPYLECKHCRTIADCPHPDVANDLLGTPLPPDCCPKPIDIMNETLKKKRAKKDDDRPTH